MPEFTSQFNLYSNRTEFLGWYLGGSEEQLNAILKESGFLDIPDAVVSVSGNCSTENSRMFWIDGTTTCHDDDDDDDDEAYTDFLGAYNTMPINLEPIDPAFRLTNETALPSGPPAASWPRFNVISKTYFELKDNLLSDDDLRPPGARRPQRETRPGGRVLGRNDVVQHLRAADHGSVPLAGRGGTSCSASS